MPRRHSGSLSLDPRVFMRQLLAQPAVVTTVFIAVLIGSFLVSGIPRVTERVAERDLRATVSEPPPAQRNIRVEIQGRVPSGPDDDPFLSVRRRGEQFLESDVPAPVKNVISDSYYMMDTPQFRVSPLPGEEPPHPFDTFLRYRYQEGIEDHLTLVEGTMPTPQDAIPLLLGSDCPHDPELRQELMGRLAPGIPLQDDEGAPLDCLLDDVPHIQMAVTSKTATDMGLEIGRMMLLQPDLTDRLYFGLSRRDLDFSIVVSISGIIELSEVEEEYWYGDPNLHRPRIQENADLRIIYATGLMGPDDYREMVRTFGFVDRLYTYRHLVDPDLVERADIDTLLAELRTFTQHYASVATRHDAPTVITQLPDLLVDHLNQREETLAMLSTVMAGLLAVVIAVVLLLAVLMTERQGQQSALIRGRGASAGQLTLTRLYQGVVLVVPAAVIAYQLAGVMVEGTEHLAAYRATVALASGAVVATVLAAVPRNRQPLGLLISAQRNRLGRRSRRALVFDIAIAALAAGAVTLLRRRGQVDDPGGTGDFDLLLAITPALLATATGLWTIRAYPLLVRLLAWIGSRARGLVGFVGFRRVLLQPPAARLPVLVVVVCIGVASFAVVGWTTVRHGQEVSSWQTVGANYTFTGNGAHVNVPSRIDPTEIPADAYAEGTTFGNARIELEFGDAGTQALAVDAASHDALIRGTVADIDMPGRLEETPTPNVGQTERPIPAIVSSVWPREVRLSVGDVFTIDLGSLEPVMVVTAIRERYPGLDPDRPFVVFSLDALRAFSDLPVPSTVLYLDAPRSAQSDIEAFLEEGQTDARFTSRFGLLSTLAEDPFVEWLGQGLASVFGMSVLLAAVAAISSLALASAARRRDLAYLRTMGLTDRQATVMTVIEQFPAIVIASVAGVAIGVGAAIALDPAIDYDAFTGDVVPTALNVDWLLVGGGAIALIIALAAAVVVSVATSGRGDLGRILRVGDE